MHKSKNYSTIEKQYDIPMISHLFHIWYNYQIISFCSAMLLKALQDVLSWQNS